MSCKQELGMAKGELKGWERYLELIQKELPQKKNIVRNIFIV